jgi:hypothetical protein
VSAHVSERIPAFHQHATHATLLGPGAEPPEPVGEIHHLDPSLAHRAPPEIRGILSPSLSGEEHGPRCALGSLLNAPIIAFPSNLLPGVGGTEGPAPGGACEKKGRKAVGLSSPGFQSRRAAVLFNFQDHFQFHAGV